MYSNVGGNECECYILEISFNEMVTCKLEKEFIGQD